MFTQFFIAIFDSKMGFFEAAAGGHTLLPTVKAKYSKAELKDYENIGKVMIKAVLDRIPIPRGLATSLFVYLSKGEDSKSELAMEDLLEYDHTVYRSTNFILEQEDPEMIEAMCLTFPEELDGEEVDVTLENKKEFAQAMVDNVLINSREAPLKAMRKGFEAIKTLHDKLQSLKPEVMQTIVCGPDNIEVDLLLKHIHFVEDDFKGSSTPTDMMSMLKNWGQEDLSKFLSFTTGVANLQPDGSMDNKDANPADMIKVMGCLCDKCKACNAPGDTGCGSLPVASTCFWTLRLPICRSEEDLKERFRLGFEWGAGFGDL